MTEVIQFEVGKQNPLEVNDGISILWDENGFTINFKFNDITSQEIIDFRNGNLRIDIAFKAGVIFFILDMEGTLGMSDIAFNALISPNKEEDLVLPPKELGYSVHMILTESNNNEIKAMRVLGLNEQTTKVLYELMKDQFEKRLPISMYEYNVRETQKIYSVKDLKKLSLAYSKYDRNVKA